MNQILSWTKATILDVECIQVQSLEKVLKNYSSFSKGQHDPEWMSFTIPEYVQKQVEKEKINYINDNELQELHSLAFRMQPAHTPPEIPRLLHLKNARFDNIKEIYDYEAFSLQRSTLVDSTASIPLITSYHDLFGFCDPTSYKLQARGFPENYEEKFDIYVQALPRTYSARIKGKQFTIVDKPLLRLHMVHERE